MNSAEFFSASDDTKNINIYKIGRDNPLIVIFNY